jgi:NADH dehydrogenase (ubiquinone) Fe-S protein 3
MEKNIVFAKSLIQKIPKYIKQIKIINNNINIFIHKENILDFFFFLKHHNFLKYNVLIDITCVDFLGEKKRFEIIYQLISILFNHRICIKLYYDDLTNLSSINVLYKSSIWLEREIWDLFGIFFSNHPDLRRILTDYGFQGFPMRKDFPLTGYTELRYDEEKKRVLYDFLELTQEYRFFDFQTPWQQI